MTRAHRQPLTPDQLYASNAYRSYPSERFGLGGGVEIERFGQWAPGEVFLSPATHHRISMHVQEDGNKAATSWDIEGRQFRGELQRGMIAVVPAGRSLSASWEDTAHGTLNLLVTQEALAEVLEASGLPSAGIELVPGLHGLDPLLLDAAFRMMAELRQQRLGDRLMRDSLKLQMLVHILRRYSSHSSGPTVAPSRGARSPHDLAIRNALDYMRANLDRRLGLDDLAAVAGISRFHFARLFRQAVGRTPMQELMRLRVERARQIIEHDGAWKPMAAIAAECGFADQSHLGRHFKRRLGVTPGGFLRSL